MGFNGLSMQSRLVGWLYRTGQPPFAVLSPWQQVKHFFYLNLNIFGFFFMFYLAWHSNLVLIRAGVHCQKFAYHKDENELL